MNYSKRNDISLIRLAGIAAILGGVLIPLAFMLPDGNLQAARAYSKITEGGTLSDWANELSASLFRETALYLSATSMFCILLVALLLFKCIDKAIWQKYVSLTGYTISCILAIFVFIFRSGSEKAMLKVMEQYPDMAENILLNIYLQDEFFGIFHAHFVPVVLVLFGTGFLSWALLRAGWVPKWLCYWGLIVSVLVGIGGLSFLSLSFKILLQITPLHFIWFIALGIILLAKKYV